MAAVGTVMLTAAMVADATGGRLVAGAPDRVFGRVSTDTRAMTPGALFIALRGDRFDAHAFIPQAIAAGAAGIVVSEPPAAVPPGIVTVVVPDTLAALQNLARAVRRESGARVIAITGSAGKTTTKEVTAALLATRYRVFRNAGNLNNHVGLPLSLLELTSGPEMAVVELGMNHAGEIRALVRIAEPDVRVWTNVGDAHIGYFGTKPAIADAKAEILEGVEVDSLVVSNADDPLVVERVQRAPGRHVTFGRAETASVRAIAVADHGFDGTTADVHTPSGDVRLDVPLAGQAQLMNVLAAVAVATELGVPLDDVARAVTALRPVARRGAVHPLAGGGRLVDDSYNASPQAVHAMLAALAATPTTGRRVAVLGEMLELGDASRTLHERCGGAAAAAGAELLVVIGGGNADAIADGARRAGMPADRVHRFADSTAAAAGLPGLIQAGDLVLVKASRGTRADLVVDRLLDAA